jgi:hypothetical protein
VNLHIYISRTFWHSNQTHTCTHSITYTHTHNSINLRKLLALHMNKLSQNEFKTNIQNLDKVWHETHPHFGFYASIVNAFEDIWIVKLFINAFEHFPFFDSQLNIQILGYYWSQLTGAYIHHWSPSTTRRWIGCGWKWTGIN